MSPFAVVLPSRNGDGLGCNLRLTEYIPRGKGGVGTTPQLEMAELISEKSPVMIAWNSSNPSVEIIASDLSSVREYTTHSDDICKLNDI